MWQKKGAENTQDLIQGKLSDLSRNYFNLTHAGSVQRWVTKDELSSFIIVDDQFFSLSKDE